MSFVHLSGALTLMGRRACWGGHSRGLFHLQDSSSASLSWEQPQPDCWKSLQALWSLFSSTGGDCWACSTPFSKLQRTRGICVSWARWENPEWPDDHGYSHPFGSDQPEGPSWWKDHRHRCFELGRSGCPCDYAREDSWGALSIHFEEVTVG